MPSPACEIKEDAGAYQSTDDGFDATPASTITIHLLSGAGVNSWSISCVYTDDTSDAATVTAALTIDTVARTAVFTAPAAGKTYIFRSQINGGVDVNGRVQSSYTTTFGIYTLTADGFRVIAANETTEGSSTHGWIVPINDVIRNGGGGGGSGLPSAPASNGYVLGYTSGAEAWSLPGFARLAVATTGTISDLSLLDGSSNPVGTIGMTGGTATLNSLAGGWDGRLVLVTNEHASEFVTIPHNTGGTAANRVLTSHELSLILGPGQTAILRYDGTAARWRVEATTSHRFIADEAALCQVIAGQIVHAISATGVQSDVPRHGVPGSGTSDGAPFNGSPFAVDGFADLSIFNGGTTHYTVSDSNAAFAACLRFHSATGDRSVYFPQVTVDESWSYAKDLINESGYDVTVCVNDAQPSALLTRVLPDGEMGRFWFTPTGVYGTSMALAAEGAGVFDPETLPDTSGTLLRWLDATNLTQGGGVVTAIDDKSSNDIDPTITGGEEPTYSASEASLNNRPAWNCATGAGRAIRYGTNHGLTAAAYTVVFVGAANGPYVASENNGNMAIYGQAGSGNKWGMTNNAGGQVVVSTQAATTPAVVVCVFDGTSSKMYVSKKSSPHTNGSMAANPNLAAASYFIGNASTPSSGGAQNGLMTHYLIYSGALSQTDVDYLLDGFGAEAGITITP